MQNNQINARKASTIKQCALFVYDCSLLGVKASKNNENNRRGKINLSEKKEKLARDREAPNRIQ